MDNPFNFHHPSTILIAGPTGCGKTKFVSRIIETLVPNANAMQMIVPSPTRVVWVYSEWQPIYENLVGLKQMGFVIEFVKCSNNNLSEMYDSFTSSETNLIILDDLMSSTSPSQKKKSSNSSPKVPTIATSQ